MKIFLIFALTSFSLSSLAYNDSKCDRVDERYFWGAAGLVSTSQFTTSTGECSALGSNEQIRETYYASNFENIKSEAAKGGGESLSTLLAMSNCQADSGEMLSQEFQKEYEAYFNQNSNDSYLKIRNVIDNKCRMNRVIFL